jgi:hypothetical protein
MMTLPAFVLGVLLSTFYGAVFHLLRGGSIYKLVLDIILSWLGFWTGHILAGILGWTFLSIGPLHLGLATIVSFLCLFIGHWLSLIPKKPEGIG